jgi:hypothetical protein
MGMSCGVEPAMNKSQYLGLNLYIMQKREGSKSIRRTGEAMVNFNSLKELQDITIERRRISGHLEVCICGRRCEISTRGRFSKVWGNTSLPLSAA